MFVCLYCCVCLYLCMFICSGRLGGVASFLARPARLAIIPAAGCRLPAAGCWLLAAGCWLLAAGCEQQASPMHIRRNRVCGKELCWHNKIFDQAWVCTVSVQDAQELTKGFRMRWAADGTFTRGPLACRCQMPAVSENPTWKANPDPGALNLGGN